MSWRNGPQVPDFESSKSPSSLQADMLWELMQICPNVFMLEVPVIFGSGPSTLNLAAIKEPGFGATLFDTGMPGMEHLILSALAKEGIEAASLEQIVVTHADMDHIGSLKAIKDLTGARVLCLDKEAGYVSGALPPYKLSRERLEQNPELKAIVESIKRVQPDQTLRDGESIPHALGARAIATPGHTLGHMSVYLQNGKVIVAGDALTSKEGVLGGPMEQATPDMETARDSISKLAKLEVDQIITYHGGLVDRDAQGQLRKLASQ